jgi:hypothetical protein
VPPDEAAKAKLTTFDVLMHTHHVFTDGSGIRSILNEFLTRLAQPLPSKEITWGREIDHLLPPSILLAKKEEQEVGAAPSTSPVSGVRLKGFSKVSH